ncbi:hypothetical protein DYB28_014562, partial [Aphanomyces astaci]
MQAEAIDVQSTDLEELSRLATQQRRTLLGNLTQLRKHDYAYLRSLHADPHNSYFVQCEQLYYLGLSLGRLLTTTHSSSQLAMDGCQLMDELDFYFAAPSIQNMAFPLDYCLLVVSICDVVTLVYAKLQEDPCHQPHVFQALLRLDDKLKVPLVFHLAALLMMMMELLLLLEFPQ